jgi:hypothetical protein
MAVAFSVLDEDKGEFRGKKHGIGNEGASSSFTSMEK